MTDAEWRDCSDPHRLLLAIREHVSDRKLRLFACACASRVRPLLGKGGWKLVRTAEMWADGLADSGALGRARKVAQREHLAAFQTANRKWWSGRAAAPVLACRAAMAATASDPEGRGAREAAAALAIHSLGDGLPDRTVYVTHVEPDGVGLRYHPTARGHDDKEEEQSAVFRLGEMIQAAWWDERRCQADLLRCLVPPPQVTGIDPRFMTPDVVGLARGIAEDQAFDRLPLLADALLDAGCDDEYLLAHCRSDGPHVRGCFPVDLVIAKE